MHTYAVLCHPGHNRVYFEEAKRLAVHEMQIVCATWAADVPQPALTYIADIAYIAFATAQPLSETQLKQMGRLSFFYALFEKKDDMLLPIVLPPCYYLDPGISSILKYTGKTNELFTRMLINIAVCAAGKAGQDDVRLIDPMAGKGTTLFDALALGYLAAGVEISDKAAQEIVTFFKKYLERERCKHTLHTERVGRGKKNSFTFSRTKEESKAELAKRLDVVAGDAMQITSYYKKGSFDVLVADLPYGVAHSNVTADKGARNPKELLEGCLPAWREALAKGGALALSWNTFVFSREDMLLLLEKHGFHPLTGGVYDDMEHRVDQAIRRDVVVATK